MLNSKVILRLAEAGNNDEGWLTSNTTCHSRKEAVLFVGYCTLTSPT